MPTLAPRPTRTAQKRRRLTTREKAVLAVVGSVLLHIVLLFVLGWVVPHWPHAKLHGPPPPIHLTFTPSKPAATPAPSSNSGNRPQYMRTLDEQKTDHPPQDPNFISDKDTAAASEQPANGDKPLPTQQGKEINTYDFDTRPYRAGKEAEDAASAAAAAPPPQNEPKKPDPKKPAPHSKALHPPKPPATPKPAGEIASAAPDASPTPEPPTPMETPDEASAPPPVLPQSQTNSANPSVNSRGLPHPPGYQPQTIKSKVSGGISNRGISAVSAVGTPLGKYEKSVEDAIGMLWYQYIDERMDVVGAGEIKLHFYIDRSGKVQGVHVTSGKQNSALADISIQAVTEAPIPPIPPEVAETLDGGQLEFEQFSFGVY